MGNIFKTMGESIKGKDASEKDIEEIPSFIFCRYLSGSPFTIGIANTFNRFNSVPIINQFNSVKNYSIYTLKGRLKYIPYPKGASEKELKDTEYISKYYKCSLERAKEYLEFISDKELEKLRNAFREG